jgi:hypothetical protein
MLIQVFLDAKARAKGVKDSQDDIPTRLQKIETTIEEVKEAKGGRVHLRGGGCAKRGIKKNAYGRNS